MTDYVTDARLYEAIQTITRETGFPPDPDELNDVFGIQRVQSTGAWRTLMAADLIRYADHGRVVTVSPSAPEESIRSSLHETPANEGLKAPSGFEPLFPSAEPKADT